MTRRAFTLVELLVVLALIALVASLAIPTASRGLAVGRRTLCANNLHHLIFAIESTQYVRRRRGDEGDAQRPFFRKEHWPNTVVGETGIMSPVYRCPDGLGNSTFSTALPPLMYRSGIDRNRFVPFDGSQFLCCSRRGEDESGEPYTEYCIEENPWVESKWTHAPCCGQPSWSTNDGIWRVYDRIDEEGFQEVILMDYDCWWPNELWLNGELAWDSLIGKVGQSLKFQAIGTNYGYNSLLGHSQSVDPTTIVLADFNYLYIDPDDLDIISDLSCLETARHLGRINVLTGDGAVADVGPPTIYPDLNRDPWTPEDD